MKKIIIIDDLYFINKLTIDSLLKLFSTYTDDKVIFILIVKNLSDIHEMIKSRCLTFSIKEFEVTSEYLRTNYKDLNEETINFIIKNFNYYSTNSSGNSICMVDKFLFYVSKYKLDKDLNSCVMKMLKNDMIFKGKISLINEIITIFTNKKSLLDEKMDKIIKVLRKIYEIDIYPEHLLNVVLFYSIKSDISDDIKIIIIEQCVKSLFTIYNFSDSILQVNKCFIKIIEKIEKENEEKKEI